jgi:hypothetical protein
MGLDVVGCDHEEQRDSEEGCRNREKLVHGIPPCAEMSHRRLRRRKSRTDEA